MDKEALFKPRLPEDTVEVEGIGTVRVRGLSRFEALMLKGVENAGASERMMLHFAMVDPKLTEAEAGQWQRASAAGELEPVTSKIAALSGMLPNAAKDAVKEFEADPQHEFRVLPSGQAEHDGGGPTSEDVV